MENIRCPSIMDIEASGFGQSSYPIEIGIAKHNGERYCALIQPDPTWKHWSASAEHVHGISRAILKLKGRPIRDICLEINDFLGKSTIFSDAWSHDLAWLNRLFSAANIMPSFSLRAIEHIMTETQYELWDNTKNAMSKRLRIIRHRASSDAYLIQQTYMYSKIFTSAPSETIGDS